MLRTQLFRSANKQKQSKSGGFTLIEMLVVIFIMTVIMALIFFNHTLFNDQIAITNLAYDVALAVRQAQVSGVSVKETVAGSNDFNKSYGVHFDTDNLTTFVSFLDGVGGSPEDHIYNGSDITCDGSAECQQVFNITRGNKIQKICAMDSGNGRFCNIHKLDLTFKRPNPDAIIYTDGNPLGSGYIGVVVRIVSPQEIVRSIVIDRTGQISIPSAGVDTSN